MNHADVKKMMADYLEGDLDLGARALFDAHLDECEACSGEVNEMRQTISLLQRMPEPEPPQMLAANVMRRIRAGETQPTFWQRIVRGTSSILEPSFVLPASAVAVAALVALVARDPDFFKRFEVADSLGVSGFAERLAAEGDRAGLAGGTVIAARPRFEPLTEGLADASRRAPVPTAFRSSSRSSVTPSLQLYSQSVVQTDGQGARSTRRYRVEWGTPSLAAQGSDAFQLQTQTNPLRAASSRLDGRALGHSGAFAGERSRALRVAQPVSGTTGMGWLDQSTGDPRDEWLARGFEDPAGFAAFLAGKNLAEQELWVSRLADRAASEGLLEQLVSRLRESRDVTAAALSDDFLARARTQARASAAAERDFFGSSEAARASSQAEQSGVLER